LEVNCGAPAVYGARIPGLIATPHDAASRAGAEALAAGGSAADAALAAAAVLTVVYPHNCAMGGDLFALLHQADGTVHSINASGPAPAAVDPAALRRRGVPMPTVGVDAITVPGLVAGWGRLHELGGRLPWSDALATAIRCADQGAPVAPGLAAAIEELDLWEVLAAGGMRMEPGDLLVQPRLARTLERLAAGRAEDFYVGAIADDLIRGLRRMGSPLTAADLAEYVVREDRALRYTVGSYELLTCSPNSSGVLLAQAMGALARTGCADPLGLEAGVLAAIFAAGSEQRERLLADPDFHRFEPEVWLGERRIRQVAAEALAAAPAGAGRPSLQGGQRPAGDTIGVVVLDAQGQAVSLIQSLFHSFGSQVLEPSTGILFHNRGAGFSLDPAHPNSLAPRKRPAHTLMPVLVRRHGRLVGVLGAMGGRLQPQIHAQVLLRLMGGLHPQDAVAAPRFGVGPMEIGEGPTTARVEADCHPAVLAALRAAGFRAEEVPPHSDYLGHMQAIWMEAEPLAGSDPRADGVALVIP
jgi:gamma-glutamyltranspeptidase/glutathione hydrolase